MNVIYKLRCLSIVSCTLCNSEYGLFSCNRYFLTLQTTKLWMCFSYCTFDLLYSRVLRWCPRVLVYWLLSLTWSHPTTTVYNHSPYKVTHSSVDPETPVSRNGI